MTALSQAQSLQGRKAYPDHPKMYSTRVITVRPVWPVKGLSMCETEGLKLWSAFIFKLQSQVVS